MSTMLYSYIRLIRLDRPVGIFLLLWPTLWALWIASSGQPSILTVCVFSMGVVLMRSAGCVINDLTDRRFDGHVKRTQNRPLVTQALSVREAWILLIILLGASLGLVCFLNRLTIELSGIAAVLALIYPFMKRYTQWPQFMLGLAFAWGVPMAFAAVQGHVPPIAWFLFTLAVLWPMAYDTMYAMADREDDLKIGIKSTAIWLGEWDHWAILSIQIILWLLSGGLGVWLHGGLLYFGCWLASATILAYQQYLIKSREPQHCLRAFLIAHWFGALIFLGILLSYYNR